MKRFSVLCLVFLSLAIVAATKPTSAAKDFVDSAIFTNDSNAYVDVRASKAGPPEAFCVPPGDQASRYYLFKVYSYEFDFMGKRRCHTGFQTRIKKDFRQPHTVFTLRGDHAGNYRVDVST